MPDTLSVYAASQPGKLAVIDDRPDGTVTAWTYAELEARSNRLANLLLSLGARPRSKVLWCGPNSPQVVMVMSATRKIGVVAVPLNYRLTPEEALYVVNHSDAEIVYVDVEHAPMFAALRDRLEKVRHIIAVGGSPGSTAPEGMLTGADVMAAPASAPEVVDADAGGRMIYPSGTTGKPKGAVRPTQDPASIGALLGLLGYRPDDVYITAGPLYHSGPSAFLGAGLLFGQTVIVQRKFDAEDWLRLVDKYKASSTFSAPALVRMICALPRRSRTATTVPPCGSCWPTRPRGASLSSSSTSRTSRPSRCSRSTGRPSSAWPPSCSPKPSSASRAPAASPPPVSRSSCSTTTATRSPAPARTIPARSSCGPRARSTPITRTTPATSRTAAATTTRSATSPTGTTRATCTSATARPT